MPKHSDNDSEVKVSRNWPDAMIFPSLISAQCVVLIGISST